jgi:hypothetical protein
MANIFAIHSVGASLVTYLRNSYPNSLRGPFPCQFSLFSSGDLVEVGDIPTTLSLFLYRVTMNEHLRNAGRINGSQDENVPLALDLHYLMTVWASSAEAEHSILAWAMRQLYHHSVLDISSLSAEAEWNAGDVVQIIPAELSNEDIMRIWDALNPPYRLSVSYMARVVRINPETEIDSKPVVASRFSMTDREALP